MGGGGRGGAEQLKLDNTCRTEGARAVVVRGFDVRKDGFEARPGWGYATPEEDAGASID